LTAGVFTKAVQQKTKLIPILTVSDDLLAERAVTSLAQPGGNTTGISIFATELDGKRQEFLLGAVPLARRLGILVDPSLTQQSQLDRLVEAGKARGIGVSVHRAVEASKIVPAMDEALAAGAQALNVLASSLFNRYRSRIIEHAAGQKLPAIYQWPEAAEEGGLLAYGPLFVTLYRQHARQLLKVFEGVRPADIPVEQPTTFELVINLRTARDLGLDIPPAMFSRADKVIE
jgi:putative ABC transport system substrate-binding protein